MTKDKFIISNADEYEYAKKRFQELFHACPCITDNEEGLILYDALEEYELQLKKQSE